MNALRLRIAVDGRYGFVDADGAIAIPPRFEFAHEFREGRARIRLDGAFAFVDEDGQILASGFEEAEDFREGVARVTLKGRKALIGRSGEVLVSGADEIGEPGEGLVQVTENYKTRFVDRSGATKVGPLQHTLVSGFREGLAVVGDVLVVDGGGKYQHGYIDTTGTLVIPQKFDSAGPFVNGLAIVMNKDYKSGLIDRTGKLVVPARYQEIRFGPEDMAIVWKDQKWGYVDLRTRKEVVLRFEEAREFSEGLACVALRGKSEEVRYGFIDRTGEMIIDPEPWTPLSFSGGLAAVHTEDGWGFIGPGGKFAIKPQFDWDRGSGYDGDAGAYRFAEGLAAVLKDGRWGYIDAKGAWRVKPAFDRAGLFFGGIAAVDVGGRTGLINADGKFLLKPCLDWLGSWQDGIAPALFGGRMAYVDRSGRLVWKSEVPEAPVTKKRMESDLRLELTAHRGTPFRFDAVLANRSPDTVHRIVAPGDGSDAGWREPHVFQRGWTRDGGSWRELKPRPVERCGMYDHCWQRSVRFLHPNEELVLFRGGGPAFDFPPGPARVTMCYRYSAGRAGKGPGAKPVEPTGLMRDLPAFDLESEPLEFTAGGPVSVP